MLQNSKLPPESEIAMLPFRPALTVSIDEVSLKHAHTRPLSGRPSQS
jgi:hypothetical protein